MTKQSSQRRRAPAAALQLDPLEAPLLGARGLHIGYDGRAILPPLSFDLRAGEFWALVGPNGGGKTTLLRTLLGLLPRVEGSIQQADGLRIGYVPQRNVLDLAVPARVIDLVRGGADFGWSFLSPQGLRRRRDAIARAQEDTNVASLANHAYRELSEGQKQRVLLARALVGDPGLLVLDEPTSAMDAQAEENVFSLIHKLQRQRSLAVLVVSHHLAVVTRRATHLLFVCKDDGCVVSGPVAIAGEDHCFVEHYGSLAALQDGATGDHGHGHGRGHGEDGGRADAC